jgi:hypothetical protein
MDVGRKIYKTLWGGSDIPDNRIVEFLLSNFSYIVLGLYLILKQTNDYNDNDRVTRAWIIILVGFVSAVFHSSQVTHGHDDHRTGYLHYMDIATAVAAFLFSIFIRGIENIPSISYILLALSIPFYFYNGKYYWLTHSIWHLISALVLFTILDY